MYPNTGVADCQEAKHRANGECDSTSMHWATLFDLHETEPFTSIWLAQQPTSCWPRLRLRFWR